MQTKQHSISGSHASAETVCHSVVASMC